MKIMMEPPPLAYYRKLTEYSPSYGDFIVMSFMFSTRYAIVVNISDNGDLVVISESLPMLLFTINDEDKPKNTKTLKIEEIKNARDGKYAIQRTEGQNSIWYI